MSNIETMANQYLVDSLKEKLLRAETERDEYRRKLESNSRLVMSGTDLQLEENIAQIQLAKLNEISMGRELTLEEAKKCEIYSKILNNIRGKGMKDVGAEVRNLGTDDLLKQLEHETKQ